MDATSDHLSEFRYRPGLATKFAAAMIALMLVVSATGRAYEEFASSNSVVAFERWFSTHAWVQTLLVIGWLAGFPSLIPALLIDQVSRVRAISRGLGSAAELSEQDRGTLRRLRKACWKRIVFLGAVSAFEAFAVCVIAWQITHPG